MIKVSYIVWIGNKPLASPRSLPMRGEQPGIRTHQLHMRQFVPRIWIHHIFPFQLTIQDYVILSFCSGMANECTTQALTLGLSDWLASKNKDLPWHLFEQNLMIELPCGKL